MFLIPIHFLINLVCILFVAHISHGQGSNKEVSVEA